MESSINTKSAKERNICLERAIKNKKLWVKKYNFPFSPIGPQIIFSLYSQNWWRCETSRGYARIHVPLGGDIRDIHAPLLIPRCINPWAALANWFTGRNPELRDPKVLADSSKTKGLSTQSYGEMVVQLQTICRGGTKMGLDWGQRLASTSSSFSWQQY